MDDIIKECRDALDLSYRFDKDNRREAVEDLRFVAGFQWSDSARQERQGRPLITINRSGQFIRQVSNPIRQNMPTIKVEPDGDDQGKMADIANGMFRRIQYNSSASHVYANAVEHMVACGIGWWRICTDYMNDSSFDQEILIKRVHNPLSVYPDPSSLEPDRSDMEWCIVSELWPIESFKKKWPGKDLTSVDVPNNNSAQQAIAWGSADSVRVAEYWRRKPFKKKIAQLKNGQVVELTGEGTKQVEMLQSLGVIAAVRDVDSFKVEMAMVSGAEQLEETYECPSKWIPIVPVIGNEIPIEQGTYRHGLIRFQREPQQLHNYFMSVAAESLGQQPRAPYLVTQKQIGKHKTLWDNANRVPTPYLPYEPDPDVPGGQPTRIQPPPLPAGLIQMAQMLAEDMKATTGIYDAALGAQSNETSGVAIGQRAHQGEQATYHYVDNLEHGLEHTGRIILDMIPKVYDNQRSMRMKGGADKKEETVVINKPVMSYDGQEMVHNDMSQMSFTSVRVILGQNFASRKQQNAQILVGLLQAMPQIGAVAGDIVAKNLDIDDADELAERLHSLLPPQILAKEGEENGQPPPPPPDPMQDPMVRSQVELNMANAAKAWAQAQAANFDAQSFAQFEGGEQPPPTQQADVMAAHGKAAQEQARAVEAGHKATGAALDNLLRVKKLREPPPQPKGQSDRD